jgi:hypothetical protein
MQDWERELWRKHDGAWVSRYTIYDAERNVVDQYLARNDMVSDFGSARYFQRNLYRRGNQIEERRFAARYEGRSLVFEGGRLLEGHARAFDPTLVVLRFQYLDKPFSVVETITLGGDRDRARTMQQFEDGLLKRVTAVFGERKVLDAPGVDIEGHDLYPVGEDFWKEHFPELA